MNTDDSVWTVPTHGGTATALAPPGASNPQGGIAVDATGVYWTNLSEGTVRKVALSGGPVVLLASGQSYPYGIQADGSHVYWANFTGGTVMTASIDGSGLTAFAIGQNGATDVAQDANNVYWTDQGDGTVRFAAKLN